ncbi:MAG: MFS transporter [Bacillota bacterium]
MKRETRKGLTALCGVPFAMVLSNSMIIPVLPAIQSRLQLSAFEVGLIITAFSVPAGLTIPLAGILSDRIGRVKVMVPALLLFGLGGLLAGLAAAFLDRPFAWILAARIVQGIGGGGTYQLAMAEVGDIFQTQERTKALGLLEAANGLGKVVAPIIGAAVGVISWYAPFFVYLVIAAPVSAAVWFLVREPEAAPIRKLREYFQQTALIFQQHTGSIAATFVSGLVILFMLFGVLSVYSDILENSYGLRGTVKGLVIAIPVGLMALTSLVTGTALQAKRGTPVKWSASLGNLLLATGLFLFPFSRNVYYLTGVISLQGIGSGLVLPAVNTVITGTAAQSERGLLTSLYGTVRFFGAALGPPVFGLLTARRQCPLFLLSGLVAVVTAAVVFSSLLPQPKYGSEGQQTAPSEAEIRQYYPWFARSRLR